MIRGCRRRNNSSKRERSSSRFSPLTSHVNTRARVVRADGPLTSVYKELLAGEIGYSEAQPGPWRGFCVVQNRGGNFERHPTTRNQLCLLLYGRTTNDIRFHDRSTLSPRLYVFSFCFASSFFLFFFFNFFFFLSFFALVDEHTENCVGAGYKLYLEGRMESCVCLQDRNGFSATL